MLTEIARIFLSGIILFYAAINLGFLSPYQSQVNEAIWVDLFYQNIEHQQLIEQQRLFEQKNSNDKQYAASQNTEAGGKQLTIPLDIPSDSTNNGNVPVVNTSLPKDTSLVKDSSLVKKNVNFQVPQQNVPLKTPSDSIKSDIIIGSHTRSGQPKDSLRFSDPLTIQKTISQFKDSLGFRRDTTKIDSMAIDSTARLKYMKYSREDVPNVQLNLQDQSDFFAKPSETVARRVIEIDSTGKYVEVKDVVGSVDRRILLRMPLNDYINLQLALNETNIWDNNFNSLYAVKSSQKELGQLIKDITSFEIPLPSTGVLSIFGKPVIKLTIGGAVDIHAAWNSTTTEGVTTSALGNTQNEPNFQQQVQINVDGEIGDKLNIHADWNTERTFEYQNMLHIKYTGYEDEIVQSIEAGNVAMQASPLVGGSEALFGIKAQFKLGPISLTTLASQQKGQMKEVSVNNGTQSTPFAIRAWQYATNNFFIDTVYASPYPKYNLFYNYYGNSVPSVSSTYKVIQIQVWKSLNTVTYDLSKERKVNAYINLPPLPSSTASYDTTTSYRTENLNPIPGSSVTGRFTLLTEGTDYIMHYETGYITFLTTVNDNDAIAVAYSDNGGSEHYGEFINTSSADTSKRIVLKLVKAPNLQPQYTQAWSLMLKNIYSVGATNIQQNGFTLQIKYEIPGQTPVTTYPEGNTQIQLLHAFGFDTYDASGNTNPDNIFDYRPSITILPVAGEIIFPSLEPFSLNYLKANGFTNSADTSLAFQAVYDTSNSFAQQDQVHDKWSISGSCSGDATSVYQLGFNVVENSVKLTLNGKVLTPGQDYSIDYNTGQLNILNSNALIPGADLKITYEQNDLFTLASKTMLGARAVVNFSDKTKLGFSILNLNEQSLNDKVRIGEEPLSNTMMGIDFNTASDLPFLTDALDKVISTKQMSSFTFAGEFAHMAPDPNTIKSTITDDGGQSVAYIDDFEGAEKIIPIGVGYTAWKDLSAPDSLAVRSGFNTSQYIDDPTKTYYQNLMRYKAKSWWFSVTPSNVKISDIWGSKKQASEQDQQESVMDYVFKPDAPGSYNMNPKSNFQTDQKQNWGGMMKALSSTANNLQAQNMQYIQFWMQTDPTRPIPDNAKIYIDLGRISEDVIPDGQLNTEDKNNNGVIDQGEDVGLDGLTDAQEIDSAKKMGYSSQNSADPNNDDFSLNSPNPNDINSYSSVNGTEGNSVLTDIGRIPDTEDLNNNGNLDLVNSFYRYEVPLDTNAAKNMNLIAGGDNTGEGWHLFKIPLQKYIDSVGTPTLSDVEYIRVFVTGVDQLVHVRLAEFNLVGNTWQQVIPYDTIMSLSVKNIEDNPDYYSPPGLSRELDRTVTTATVYKNEQSMDLIVSGLKPGVKREVVDYLPRPLDVFNYQTMKIFFHGDINANTNISGTTGGKSNAVVYLRFGTDTNNYYEYRQPVARDWNDASIIFKDLTAIKEAQVSANDTTVHYTPVSGSNETYYGIKGNPSLTSVNFFTVGIVNNTTNTTLSGEVWVNELRVLGADSHSGNAYTLSTSLKLADLMNINFNMSHTDPYFHSLSDQFGSRVDTRSWSLNTSLDFLKLLPFNMGTGSSLSLNYSHTENIQMPLYLPGTDISVDEYAAKANSDTSKGTAHLTSAQILSSAQTIATSDSWSLGTIALKIPTSYWLIRDTFNALSFSFNFNKTFGRNPTILSNTTWLWNAGMNYSVNSSPADYFMPAKIPLFGSLLGFLTDYRDVKVYFAPQSFSFNVSAARNRSYTTTRPTATSTDSTGTGDNSIFSHDFTTARGFNFSWKFTDGGILNLAMDYSATVNSSLAYLETGADNNLLPESQIWREIFSGAFFGRDYAFQQNLNFRTSPKLPSIWDIDKNFNLAASYSVGYQWAHNFSAITQDSNGNNIDAGRSAGFQNRSQVSLKISLKALMDPFFSNGDENLSLLNGPAGNNAPGGRPSGNNPEGRQRNFGHEEENKNPKEGANKSEQNTAEVNKNKNFVPDTTVKADSLSLAKMHRKSPIQNAALFLKTIAKTLFFDYETININFSNSNTVSKQALAADGTGLSNFWGFTLNKNDGPSRLFMLGLDSDPGDRVLGLNTITDVFSQNNNVDLSTSRPLWEGAKIDLSWKLSWTLNESTPLTTYQTGGLLESAGPISATGTISRSFFSLPPVSVLSSFKSGIGQVQKLYNQNAADPQASLSHAFIEGFETLPLLSQLGFLQNVANYVPRPNWTITWDGLEKYFPFKAIAEKVSLDHSYSSSYTEGWYIDPNGNRVTQTQQVNYAFAPLVGLNMTFGKLWNGSLSGNIKYATSSTYVLGLSTANITQADTRDIGISATYTKSGFELPLFGVSLKNDIEFTFAYTYSESSTVLFTMGDQYTDSGTPQDGQTRVTIEPRVKYTISSKVTLSIFYTRTTVQPAGASNVIPTTSNEAGLDVHIGIGG